MDGRDLSHWMRSYGQSDSVLEAAAALSASPQGAPVAPHQTFSETELVDAAMALEWLGPEDNDEEPLVVGESELALLYTAPRDVGDEPIPATAAAIVFDWLVLESIDEQPTDDTELDGDPLAVQFE